MVEPHVQSNLTPWAPTPTQLPPEWVVLAHKLAQEVHGSPRAYVMSVKYDGQRVGNLLCSWGLPWQIVMAGYLWEYDQEHIRRANLHNVDQVLSHISETNLYASYIEDENLPPLLTPPYRDLGALLIAVAIYYQALQILQEESNKHSYIGTTQSNIESVASTLLNIAKRLGMWRFKRTIEDLTENLRSPRKFAEAQQMHMSILKQDAMMLEDTRQLLIAFYQETTQQQIAILATPCGITGMKRRLQDAHAATPYLKTHITGFDLVTFDIMVPTVRACYAAFGVLSQLGHLKERVIDQIANPKPNGYSHIVLSLILKPQEQYTQRLKWPETYTRVCQIQITTHLMHAVTWYGCLYPRCFQLYIKVPHNEEIKLPSVEQLWNSEEGKVFLTISENLVVGRAQPDNKAPIVVYDKNRKPFGLPKGATALDFAYALDSTIGDHAVDAIINNRIAPLYRILDAGDIIEIRVAREVQVEDGWLSNYMAKTQIAQRQINESLNRRFLDRKGSILLRQVLERYHFMLTPEALNDELHLLLKQHNLGTAQAYLASLDKAGEPPYNPVWAAQKIMQQIAERNEPVSSNRPSWVPMLDMQLNASKKFYHQQRLCSFCQPMYPRDMKIMGRLRQRNGILVVHKMSCPHLIDRTTGSRSILLPMAWQLQPPAFRVAFFIIAQDRKGLVLDITRQLRRHQSDLLSFNAEAMLEHGKARIRFIIETHTDEEVLDILQELSNVENVTKVEIDAATTPEPIYKRLQESRKQTVHLSDKTLVELAWEESLTTLQPRSSILKNPFDISRPATAKMFFGRSIEMKTMQRELCESEEGRAIIISGPRRSGKSSICKNFLERQIHFPHWGVLFSLQNANSQTEEMLLMQLAEKVCIEFSTQLQRPIVDWRHHSDSDPQIRFRHILQSCIAQLPGSRLILALDEFGGALEAHKQHILDYRFFGYWKELMNEIPQLSLILSLPTNSHTTLISGDFANAFSFAQSLPVQFLDKESAQRLLVDPLRDQNIIIHPNTVTLAIKLTGGNPYYMTLLGQQLIHQLNRDSQKQLVTDEDLRFVVDQIIEAGSNQSFVYHRRELQNNDELRVLEKIIELTTRTNQTTVQLKKIASSLNVHTSFVRYHVERLRNGLILEETNPQEGRTNPNPHYSFRIELVHRWLSRNRWFFSQSV